MMWRASCDTCGWEQRADDYAAAGEAARGHGDDCPDASTLVDRVAGGEESVPKVARNGKVAVLVSYGFGAGWSTWASNELSERAVFCPELVDWVEKGKQGEPPVPDDLASEYPGGIAQLEVEWVDEGDRFTIDEYDGSERLQVIGPDWGYVA